MEKAQIWITMNGATGTPLIRDVSVNGKSLPVTKVEITQDGIFDDTTLTIEISMSDVNIKFESPVEE